jgi:hypothetical protein
VLDGDLCFGETATQSPVVYLTEQAPASFREVLRRGGLLEREDLSVLSYWDVKGLKWPAIADLAHAEATRIGARLIIVDTLSQFAGFKGEAENASGDGQEAVAPLQRLAAADFGVIYTRHARKSGGDVGDDGRGSSAISGVADILISLKRPEGHQRPTLRVLEGLSRFDETPARLVIEKVSAQPHLSGIEVQADSFRVLGDADAVATDEAKDGLLRHLPTVEEAALTILELVTLTSAGRPALQRALKAVPGVRTIGKGKRGDPLRYFKPEEVSAQTSNSRFASEQKGLGARNLSVSGSNPEQMALTRQAIA